MMLLQQGFKGLIVIIITNFSPFTKHNKDGEAVTDWRLYRNHVPIQQFQADGRRVSYRYNIYLLT